MLHLATPDTGGEGVTSVAAAVSGGGQLFGPVLTGAQVQVRYGVHDRVDVGVDASAVAALGNQLERTPHRGIYAVRVFTHWTIVPRWLAVHAGLGGGGSAAGGYLAPDIGATLGYENRWAVPYAHLSFVSSHPLTQNRLDLTIDNDSMLAFGVPYTTVGGQFGGGLRFPVGPRAMPFGSIYLEMTSVLQFGNDPSAPGGYDLARIMSTFGVAYQHRFGPRRPAPAPRRRCCCCPTPD
jgi:hypothetical protein